MTSKKVTKLAADVVLVLAFVVFVFGLWLAWHPLGFIVGGLLVSAGALFVGYSNGSFRER